ncbi:MAG TPA: hypothetical protein PKE40_14275 [Arachnia sp.]|nr:hypothetical protein [Arachnia sp.]HMT87510.1 hypothetical protein [Arachnia sp.]
MTDHRITPVAEVSEADLVDQLTPADPADEPDRIDSPSPLVDEADWLDQQRSAPLDDPGE